jgi:hypothetical protein
MAPQVKGGLKTTTHWHNFVTVIHHHRFSQNIHSASDTYAQPYTRLFHSFPVAPVSWRWRRSSISGRDIETEAEDVDEEGEREVVGVARRQLYWGSRWYSS